MAEPPPRKPKVPRRKELEESYKSLEEAAAAARHRRDVELFEAAQRSKFQAENRQGSGSGSVISGEPIQHSPLLPPAPPSSDFAFGFSFEGLSPSPVRSPDAVGINGLSSGVTTGGYFEPSSSGPPRPTSRRSAFEEERERLAFEASERSASEEESEHSAFEEELERSALEEELKRSAMEEEERKNLASKEERQRVAFEASQISALEKASQRSAFEEERKNMAFGAFAEERKNPELFVPPPEESHKVIQVKDAAPEEERDKPSPKLYLQFSGLTYTVCKQPSRWQRFKAVVLPGLKATRPPPKPLRLLDGISGEARDGEILAVMGPSGSGKSTLIDALAQRIDAVKGTMTLNGNHFSERLLRNISAYVMQDDLLYPMLTVKETLMFSAFFRLPPSQSKATKVARVNNLLDQLGLLRVANTIIGDEGHRGVSGGERRRVSIGIDIIHDPLILFLDEPTSGLDSTSAFLVVRTLQKIAQTGSLVILSIHQPSYRIMGLFDHLIILAFGEKVYGGRPMDLNLFFEEFGRPVPKHENSTEHALDLIQELHASQDGNKPLVEFCKAWEAKSQPPTSMETEFPDANAAMSSVLLNEKVLASKGTPKMENGAGGGVSVWHGKTDAETVCTFANPWWAEVVVLVRRSWKNIKRTPELFLMRLATVLVTGFILATIFWHLDTTPLGVQERLGFFAFAMSTTYYTCADALPVFLQERYIFMRETATNAYRKSSYVLAHAIIYVPFLAILSLGYCIIIWWAVGLAGGRYGFLFLFLIVWASFWAGNSFVTLLSAIMPNVMVGYTITVAMLAYFLLLSGFFISRLRIPWYWRWFHYISIIKYPYEAVLLNEFGKTKSCFEIGRQLFYGTPLAKLDDRIIDGILSYIQSLPALRQTQYAQLDSTSCILTGHDVLLSKEIIELSKWKCLGITIAFGILFRCAFYIVIRITGKNKRD